MIGVWLDAGRLQLRTDLEMPEPGDGEALIRVTQAGICNTDLELVRGYYPYTGILGHEFVGIVEAAPEGHEALLGHRVVGEINAVCGDCPECTSGRPRHCRDRTVLGIVNRDGAFAEHLTLPVENLHAVPDSVPDEAAVFAEPLAAALEIQAQVELDPEHRVLVIGDGKLGQLIARTLHLTGIFLRVAGRHDGKLDMLAGLGIDTLNVSTSHPDDDLEGTLRDFDVVVECTGNPSGFELARRAVRPRGTIVLKSTYAGDLTLDVSRLVIDEITLVGSRCGPFEPTLELLKSGQVYVEELIADRYPLSAAVAAFEQAAQPGCMKILLQIG